MPITSILYLSKETTNKPLNEENVTPPDYFVDLNLDQVVKGITVRKSEYKLLPFFYSPLHDADTIYYRQEVARDLDTEHLMAVMKEFSEKMVKVRRYLALVSKLIYTYHREGWYLEAVLEYCRAVSDLTEELSRIQLTSRALISFREYITAYTNSTYFIDLKQESTKVKSHLAAIQYNVKIKDNWVGVRKFNAEMDYSQEIEKTFEKFKQDDVKNYRIDLVVASGMNHVEAKILECVAKLFPDTFKELDEFCAHFHNFLDEGIANFDREIQFYISYLDFIAQLKGPSYKFCYPKVSAENKEIYAYQTFDIALAYKFLKETSTLVVNDFYLKNPERIIVVSGPNQGGKTTFARMFGQLHYLASLGLPIPGKDAQMFIPDQIYTHFEKEEDIRNLRGKLQDELVRIRSILDKATSSSVIIMNEIFTSTTLKDAIFLSKQIMEHIIQLDCLAVCVSFIDELSVLSEKTISMVSTIVPDSPALRTFKIIRKPADGLSYAISIAEKHRLTYDLIKERIVS